MSFEKSVASAASRHHDTAGANRRPAASKGAPNDLEARQVIDARVTADRHTGTVLEFLGGQ